MSDRPQRILFHRDFRRYSGGHQKVADYFDHCRRAPNLAPFISFSADSLWDASNPWLALREQTVPFVPDNYDLLFLAGLDWLAYLDVGVRPDLPVVNLVQGVRHADPDADVYPFLSNRAIRICVSEEVADAINSTGLVNGPVVTIPNGVELALEPCARERDLFILGYKYPEMAAALAKELDGLQIRLNLEFESREEVLRSMASSHVTVILPFEREGFCLPALEAMHLSDVVIVPDCIGNRSFCSHGSNCLMPGYSIDAVRCSVFEALDIVAEPERLTTFKRAAGDTVARHSLETERNAFLNLLDRVPAIWSAL